MCRGGLFIRGSDLFIKIEEGLILAGAVHTGGEHPVGGIVFLIAFGDDVGEVEPVERPVGDGGAELGCRVSPDFAGHGYGTEAFAAAAKWALYKLYAAKVVAKCYKENEASYKMLSACMRRSGEDDTFY